MRRLKFIIAFIFSFLFFWIFYCLITLPSLTGLGNKTRAPSIIVFDKNNEIVGSIGDVYGGEILKIKEVPQHLIDSILILEDRRFYTHHGIDFKGLLRAISANLREMKYVQGASTITQQLSKLIFWMLKKISLEN